MKNLNIKSKLLQISFLTLALLVLNACKDEPKSIEIDEETVELEKPTAAEQLLVGSWKDTSPSALHFTLFEDGTAKYCRQIFNTRTKTRTYTSCFP